MRSTAFQRTKKIYPLTSVRFFGAFLVVFHHTVQSFLPAFSDRLLRETPRSFSTTLLLFMPVSVSFFFLLSGYVLSVVYLREGKASREAQVLCGTVCANLSSVFRHARAGYAACAVRPDSPVWSGDWGREDSRNIFRICGGAAGVESGAAERHRRPELVALRGGIFLSVFSPSWFFVMEAERSTDLG